MQSSTDPHYKVFISHAGEDKATIAMPLREALMAHGITAFVDEADMHPGTDAQRAMIHAMETADIAIIVLSPEFVARKWPMKELMCFLKRRECATDPRLAPTVIPFFYRLQISELYDEPRLDRLDKDGYLLYHKSRFYERQQNGDREANIAAIKTALHTVHGIMGIRNDVDASNDSAYVMSVRREFLLQQLCDKVRQAVLGDAVKAAEKRSTRAIVAEAYHAHFDVSYDTDELVHDFDTKDDNGDPSTQEGKLLANVLDQSQNTNRTISVRGIGGVGKTSLLRGIRSLERVRQRFMDGVYNITLGMDAMRAELIEALAMAVQNSGGEQAHAIRAETDIRKVIHLFRTWFAEKQCLFVLDDVWETKEIPSGTIHELFKLHASGRGSKVLLATRSVDIASNADVYFGLEPRSSLGYESRKILFRYARIEPEQDNENDRRVLDEILQRCSGLPLFLAVAGKALRALSLRRGHEECVAYHIYARSLEASMRPLLTTDVGSYEGLSARLMISVELLEQRRNDFGFRVPITVAQIHRRLSVITKHLRVPMSMLKRLWELNNESQAANVARELEQVGLAEVEFENRESGPVELLQLHDSVYQFAVFETLKLDDESLGHETLLRGYGSRLVVKQRCREWWQTCLEADGYIHGNLCRHLLAARRSVELVGLLLSPQWAERQLKINGILFLEADFALGMEAVQCGMADVTDEDLSDMETALRLISEVVALSSGLIKGDIAELWFQMHGRLRSYAESCRAILKYVSGIETDAARPLVLCKNRFLSEPGGAGTRIICVGVPVNCMVMMKDGVRVACGCEDGRIFLVNLKSSELELQWKAHSERVTSIAIGKDRERLISGSLDCRARVWEVETGRCVATFSGHLSRVNGIAVMGDGRRVISCSYCAIVRIWDVESGQAMPEPFAGHEGPVNCIAVMGDSEQVVTGGRDGTLRIWNVTSGEQVNCVAVLGDNEQVVTGGGDQPFSIWKLISGEQVADYFENGHSGAITCVAVSPDCQSIVSGSWDNAVSVWDVGNHQQLRHSLKGHTASIECVAVSGDGRRIASGSSDKMIRLWDSQSGNEVCDPLEGHGGKVVGVSFLADADRIVSCSWDGTVRIWDIGRAAKKGTDGHEDRVTCVCFSPDGQVVISGSLDQNLRAWDTTSGEQVGGSLKGHSAAVEEVFVTTDGLRIISVDVEHIACTWELETNKLLSKSRQERLWKHLSCINTSDVQVVDETAVHDATTLSIPLSGHEIIYSKGSNRQVLATLEVEACSWALSPDKKTICVGLSDGQVAFMKLEK